MTRKKIAIPEILFVDLTLLLGPKLMLYGNRFSVADVHVITVPFQLTRQDVHGH